MGSALSGSRLVHVAVAMVFLILPPAALGQEVGVKGGVNFASLTPEEGGDVDTSQRLGPVGGVWVRLPFTHVAFQAEGLFSEKGVKFKAPGSGLDELDLRVRYIEIPLLARVDFGASGSAARPFVLGGAAPAFKLSTRAKAVADGQEQSREIDDQIHSVDVGLVGGAGLQFGRALIEVRYTYGLRHINTDDNGEGDRIKNRVVSVMLGVRLWR
jgi:outer membrane protein with beta-barrel domain